MIIHLKSEFNTSSDSSFQNYKRFFFRMWAEIQSNAKIEMLHVLYMSRIALADGSEVPSMDEISAETFYKNEPPSKIVLKRWKFIIDMFVENGFI